MKVTRRTLLRAAGAAIPFAAAPARAESKNVIRIGVLTDMSGPYRDVTGPTSVACARQAVEDFAGQGFAVEILVGDHQNKPDIGATIAANGSIVMAST